MLDTKHLATVLNYKKRLDFNVNSSDSDESRELSAFNTNYLCVSKLVQKQIRLNEDEINNVVKEYKSGKTVIEISKMYRCHKTTISKHLHDQGVEIRDYSIPESKIKEAIKLYESGMSCSKIGKTLSFDGETIRKKMKKRGVRMREANGRPSGSGLLFIISK